MSERQEEEPLRILQLLSCRSWPSDAWAAVSLTLGLQEQGHHVVLVGRKGEGESMAARAAEAGVRRIDFLSFRTGFRPWVWRQDILGLRELWRAEKADVLHVHRGQEHWLAAAALRLFGRNENPHPVLIRSRHILEPVRTHPPNRWLYNRATDRILTATEGIRAG